MALNNRSSVLAPILNAIGKQRQSTSQSVSHYAKYGEYITLHGTLAKDASAEKVGALSAIGFTDTRLFFQVMPFNLLQFDGLANEDELSIVNNYRDFVFQVWPKLNFEAHKEYRKALRNKKKYDVMKNSNDPAERDLAQDYELNLLKLWTRCEEEKLANLATFKTFSGQTVTFGSEIQLMHKDSGLFLTGKAVTADTDKSAYRLELSSTYSSGMVFKVISKFKIRQEGETIQYNDQVLLLNTKLECYLNFNEDIRINLDNHVKKNPEGEIKAPYKQLALRTLDRRCYRHEAHLSQSKETVWRMKYHARLHTNEKVVRGGDLIRLRHTEFQCYLAADINYENENAEVFVRKYKGQYSEEDISIAEIWEVEPLTLRERGEPIRTNPLSGQNLNTSMDKSLENHFRLRHFLTGRVVVLKKVNMAGVERLIPVLANDNDESSVRGPDSAVSFIPTIVQGKTQVLDRNSYSIGFRGDTLFLGTVPEHYYYTEGPRIAGSKSKKTTFKFEKNSLVLDSLNQYKNTANESSPKEYFMALKDSEFAVQRQATCAERGTSAEHAFSIEKVSKSEQDEVLLAMSAILHLEHLRNELRAQKAECLDYANLKMVRTILSELIRFVLKVEGEGEINPFTCEGFTYPHRQRLLKDMTLIEILTDILYYPFEYKMFTLSEIPNFPMKQVFQLSYKLIKHTIREYRPNELYASQWLELFIHQSMFSDPNHDLFAEPTLTELIDNNKRILETKIKRETIAKFVGMLKYQKPHAKYVNLLRALTVCNGEAMIANQGEISRAIFEDEGARDAICYKLKVQPEDDEIYLFANVYNEWILLRNFQQAVEARDGNDTIYEYFVSLIYLLADLCLQRNYIAISNLENIYTYDLCFAIMSREEYSDDLRTAFAKLFNCLWLDRDFQPLTLPNFLITWEEINAENAQDLFKYNALSNKFEDVQNFISVYVQRVAVRGYQKAFLTQRNKLTLTVLEICKTLLNFGFYSSMESMVHILRFLLKILNGLKDVTTPEEDKQQGSFGNGAKRSLTMIMLNSTTNTKLDRFTGTSKTFETRYKETPETHILMQVKIKILEILDIMMKYWNDNLTRKFLLEFKTEYLNGAAFDSRDVTPLSFPSPKKIIVSPASKQQANDSPDLWIQKVLKDGNSLARRYSHTNLDLILLDLILYEHQDLKKLAFETLFRNHAQQLALREMLRHIYIIEDHTTLLRIQDIRGMSKRLAEISDTIENWYGESEEAAGEISREAIKIILTLSSYLRIDQEGVKSNEPGGEIVSEAANFTMQTLSKIADIDTMAEDVIPHPDYQKIMRYLKTYTPIIVILHYDLKGRFETKEARPPIAQNLLMACMKFLTRLINSNKENQEVIAKHSDIFVKLMKRDPTLGADSLICRLFSSNKFLLSDQSAIENYLNSVTKLIEQLPLHDNRRGKLLLTFARIMRFENTVLKKNQLLILQSLSKKEFSSVLFDFAYPRTMELLTEEFFIYHKEFNDQKPVVTLPGELDYLASLLEVLACACEEKNTANQSRCQYLFTLSVLRDLYCKSGACYHVKNGILQFAYSAYFESDRELKDDLEPLSELFEQMLNDLQTVLDQGWTQCEIKDHNGAIPARIVQMGLVYNGILRNFSNLLMKKETLSIPNFEQHLQKLRTNTLKLQKITKDSKKTVEINRIINIIQKFHARSSIQDQDALIMKIQRKATKEFNLRSASFENEIVSPGSLSSRSSFVRQDSSPIRAFMKSSYEQRSKAQKLASYIDKLSSSEGSAFNDWVENEFEALIQQIANIEKIAEKEGVSISYGKVIQGIVELIEVQENPLNDNLKAVGLRILRKIVEKENAECKTPAAEWKTNDWIGNQKKITARQNELCEYGVVKMICNLISGVHSQQILHEAILLCITLLIGGNPDVQKAFLDAMREDMNNKFLWALKRILVKGFEEIKKEMNRLNERFMQGNLHGEDIREQIKQSREANPKSLKFKTIVLALRTSLDSHAPQFIKESRDTIGLVARLFRFLQLLCEGHNFELQNHLRSQITSNNMLNVKSFDIIAYSTISFGAYVKFANIECLKFGNQLLDFLIEAVEGPCRQNQETLVNYKIIDFCIDYATMFTKQSEQKIRGFQTNEDLEMVNMSVTKSLKLLYSLLEGTANKQIINQMSLHIDFEFLISKFTSDFEYFCKKNKLNKMARTEAIIETLKADSFDEVITQSFSVFILFLTLADFNKQIHDLLQKGASDGRFTPEQVKAISFFLANIASIEIMFNNDLLRVYFPIHPTTRFLSRATRKKLMLDIPRDSANEKISSFLEATETLFDEMEHLAYLNSLPFKVTAKKFQFLRNLAMAVAIIINFLMFISYYWVYDTSPSGGNSTLMLAYYDFFGSVLTVHRLVIAFGIFQCVVSGLMLGFWLILNASLTIRERWRQQVKNSRLMHVANQGYYDDSQQMSKFEDHDISTLSTHETIDLLLKLGPDSPIFMKNKKRYFGNNWTRFVYYWKSFRFLIDDGTFRFLLFHLIISIYSVSVLEITFALQLFDIVNRFYSLRSAVRSVVINGKQLILMGVLGILLHHLWASFGFWFLKDMYYESSIGETGERSCSSLLQCFITTIDFGLRREGGVGDKLTVPSYEWDNRGRYFTKVIWELAYFLTVNVIFISAIMGIIVDTFSFLRERKKNVESDMFTRCFICDLERSLIDKNGKGFEHHIKKNHHLWNYANYIFLLRQKDPMDYNGIESYVVDKLAEGDIRWIPNGQALEMRGEQDFDNGNRLDTSDIYEEDEEVDF